jgi:hypothetical protein
VGDIEDLSSGFGYLRVFRRKENVNYETFIGPNAMQAMATYIDFRKRMGENVTDESPLFTKKNKLGERLTRSLISYMFQSLTQKSGVAISTHRLRKTFETFLAVGKVHPLILSYWTGHKVKGGRDIEGKYIIPPKTEQIKLYRSAYHHIDISAKLDETAMFLAEMRTRMTALPSHQRQRFLKEITLAYPAKAQVIRDDPQIRQLLTEPNITNGGMAFSDLRFEEINESKLLTYLRAGWQVAYNLKNGRVIVEKKFL